MPLARHLSQLMPRTDLALLGKLLTLGLAVSLTSSCASAPASTLCAPCDPMSHDDCVVFRVIEFVPGRADTPVEAAPVFLSSATGLQLLAHTPESGEFVLPRRALLSQRQPAHLLFCWDNVSLACTGVRLDLVHIRAWDAFNVTLPVNPLGPHQSTTQPGLVPPSRQR